jgi:hypothetical protein
LLVVGLSVAGAAALGLASAAAHPSSQAVARTCPHPTIPVPPNEPVYTPGPTEVVSGMYIQGGAIPLPPCMPKPRGPYAGTIQVTNIRSGARVASQTVTDGHLAHIHLSPGTYNLSGHFSTGFTSYAVKIRIRLGYKTRQDAFEDVP